MTSPIRIDPKAPLRSIRPLLTHPLHVFPETAGLADLAAGFARDARSRTAYLRTPSGRLVGVVPFRLLCRAVHPREGARYPGLAGLVQWLWTFPVQTARDATTRVPHVDLDTPIRDALFQMDLHRLSDLPVQDEHGRVYLEITHDAHAKILDALLGDGTANRPDDMSVAPPKASRAKPRAP